MFFNDYGDDILEHTSKFYKRLFDWNGIAVPSTIAIDNTKILYVVSIYKCKTDYKYTVCFNTFCKIPDIIFDKLWNKRFNHKRPYHITLPNYIFQGFITKYIGYNDLHKEIEIHIRDDENNYHIFNIQDGYYRSVKYYNVV